MVWLVGRQAIPVLATLILLSYTKLIWSVFQALYFTYIMCIERIMSHSNYGTVMLLYNIWRLLSNILIGCTYLTNCSIHLLPFYYTIIWKTFIKVLVLLSNVVNTYEAFFMHMEVPIRTSVGFGLDIYY